MNDGAILLLALLFIVVVSIRDLTMNAISIKNQSQPVILYPKDQITDVENQPDFDNSASEAKNNIEEAEKSDSFANYEPKFKNRFIGPHVKFLYCFSCGYKQAFDEYSKIIGSRYPSIKVDGENYPPPHLNAILAQISVFTKMVVMVAAVLGLNPFSWLGFGTPGFWTWIVGNKLYACMMLFFVGNAVESYLTSTGAFEISYNEVPIWSKLDNGRMPSPQELIQIIESHNRLSGSSHSNFIT